jgi:hypothetical protein
LGEYGRADAPVGVDVAEMPILAALRAEGIETVDGQQVFLEARRVKTADEIVLLAQACSMVDAAYDELYEFLRPGVRENECVGLVSKVLYDLGSEYVEGVNAISGERCSPHPHVFSDRILRPGDPAFFDILQLQRIPDLLLRTLAVGGASRASACSPGAAVRGLRIALVKPGATTGEIIVALAASRGVRLSRRDGRLRATVRSRRGTVDLGEADLPVGWSPSTIRSHRGGNGVRARGPTGSLRRVVGRQDRGESW